MWKNYLVKHRKAFLDYFCDVISDTFARCPEKKTAGLFRDINTDAIIRNVGMT